MNFPNLSRSTALVIMAVVIVCGLGTLYTLCEKERARDLHAWQAKLNVAADTSSSNVEGWVQNQFHELSELSNNASFQIYFLTLKPQTAAIKDATPPAQADYLRSLMNFTANRLGMKTTGGLALIDNAGNVLLTSATMPALDATLRDSLKIAPRGQATLIDIHQAADGGARIGFLIPIYGIQADHTAANQIGALVGVRPLDANFYAMLQLPSQAEKTLEVALVRTEGEKVRYLSPLIDGSPLLSNQEQNDETNHAAPYAVKHPGIFGTRTDYRGQNVLFTGRAITGTPWTLIAKIDRHEALARSTAWNRMMGVVFLLFTVAVGATLVTLTRRPATEVSIRAQEPAGLIEEREKRLHTLHQLITVLVSLVDRRDPHAAQHSAYVALIAGETARAMKLDARTIETTQTAAQLMNLGKMDIPAELLTRSGTLNAQEQEIIRSSMATSASLIADIQFDGPVSETLQQAQEHVDGKGPLKLKGDAILISARIITAANALVGMLSPRSYRQPLSIDEAVSILRAEMKTRFDPQVIEGLLYYLDQNGGREALAQLPSQKYKAA